MRYLYVIVSFLLLCSCAGRPLKDVAKHLNEENIIITEEKGEDEKALEKTTEIIKGNDINGSGISNPEYYTGSFEITMSGYKGEIFIGIKDGAFYGTIKFYNWGNGVPQPLKSLRVNEDKIYFIRSITTREELIKYGGTDFFTQEFYGIISKDRKIIRGYYRYAGTQDNWQAIRK
ncbi:MAG: hypothetical protein KBG49_01150 [Spirochaetes bacterium]|nr:hypothetical protein [Spirochaetota bacterium]